MQKKKPIKIWDIPTRLFHWSLFLLVTATWIFGKQEMMEWHLFGGFSVLALIIFRLIWGFIGSYHARFRHFIESPANVFRYTVSFLKGRDKPYAGHNPLGAYNVLALLLLLFLQTGTGLFSSDDILTEGPLAQFVSAKTVQFFTNSHRFLETILLIFIALHILAVLYHHFIKKENLTKAMITGRKKTPLTQKKIYERPLLASFIFLSSVLAVWILSQI